MGVINVDTISGEIRRTSPDKSDSSFTWPLAWFLPWLIWCKWALFYLCFPLFVRCCLVTNLWCERVELAWELFRDGYATDRLNDASNGLEFFSLSLFVIFCNKSHHLGWVLILPLLPSVKNLQCQAFLNMILVVLEQTKMGCHGPHSVRGCLLRCFCCCFWCWSKCD